MRVLITNDDGPPGPESPFLLPFLQTLHQACPSWDIRVVIPTRQKSWSSKSIGIGTRVACLNYHVNTRSVTTLTKGNAGLAFGAGSGSGLETFVLLDATPSACVNIALCHLLKGWKHPSSSSATTPAQRLSVEESLEVNTSSDESSADESGNKNKKKKASADATSWTPPCDLVISGPNFGRNTSVASSLSSGTLGACLDASVLGVKKSIALSFAFFSRESLTNPTYISNACASAVHTIQQLTTHWDDKVQVYTVNIPLVAPPIPPVVFTRFSEGGYSSLYRLVDDDNVDGTNGGGADDEKVEFLFRPRFSKGKGGGFEAGEVGTDSWAIYNGMTSVTPIKARYECVEYASMEGEMSRIFSGSSSSTDHKL